VEKVTQLFAKLLQFLQKLPKVNGRPNCEKSPNLVTLLRTEREKKGDGEQKFVVTQLPTENFNTSSSLHSSGQGDQMTFLKNSPKI
jgi:hypothetical protein